MIWHFNEGDYITKGMANSARVLEEYIKQLEQKSNILDKATDIKNLMKGDM